MIPVLEGLYVQFADGLDPGANARVHALCDRLLGDLLPGVTDLYPGYVNLYVEFDAARLERSRARAWVRARLENLAPKPGGREAVVPVRYDGEDLAWVAAQTGMSVEDVVRLHAGRTYRVYTVGFVPGQPMLGTLDDSLYLPRRAAPRKRVPAHAVAVAVSQTCIYPLATPGGWHLLGSALEAAYDPHRERPFLLDAGDAVRFEPRDGPTPPEARALETLPATPRRPALRVEEPGLLDLVLDGGRRLGGRFGMARSGPVDARSARLANAVVGNGADAPLLELTLKGPVLTALRDAVVGFAGFGVALLVDGASWPAGSSLGVRAGQRLSFRPVSRGVRAYLSVAGGFEADAFMGSRSVDLRGLIGRPLRAGDVLGIAQPRAARAGFAGHVPEPPERAAVRLLPGPQATPEALEALASGEFTVTSPDRMGVRLEGPRVPGGEVISEATPMGAVQVTLQGDPIILLNDRGRIGGYAKPAVVHPRDLPLVAQLRPGARLRFVTPPGASADHWFLRA